MTRKKKDHDFAVNAFRIVKEATEKDEQQSGQPEVELVDGKNPHAVALGHLGGLKGGKARLKKLTPEQRKEIAKLAANARWKNHLIS